MRKSNKLIKKTFASLVALILSIGLVGCDSLEQSTTTAKYNDNNSSTSEVKNLAQNLAMLDDEDSNDNPEDFTKEDITADISLENDVINYSGQNVSINGNEVTITAGGLYILNGTLLDGKIIVNAGDEDKVKLIFNGVDISCSENSPIYVENADKVIMTMITGTKNIITDNENYTSEDIDATIYSKSDLVINGGGSLIVNANYKDAITIKDDLKVTNGVIKIVSKNNGIKGKDSVIIKGGSLEITAENDGIKSTNQNNSEKGYVQISAGTINITAKGDGIQAETLLMIENGDINIISGGGSENSTKTHQDDMMGGGRGNFMKNKNSSSTAEVENSEDYDIEELENDTTDSSSTKGLKAGVSIIINNGNININSADDAIHSNGDFTINDGVIVAKSGDDGIHSDTDLNINGGEITISDSYEGIEGQYISINGGSSYIVASDDGLNATSSSKSISKSMFNFGGGMDEVEDVMITIKDGYLYVDASGDGVDSNGNIEMSGGTVIINGPTNNGNGALDYNGEFNISGGFLLAVGSLGMAQSVSDNSTQNAVSIGFDETQMAKSIIHIETADGEEILTYAPQKDYSSVVFSSAELVTGTTYNVYLGGSDSNVSENGLYTNGGYIKGTKNSDFTIKDIVTNVGKVSVMNNFNPRDDKNRPNKSEMSTDESGNIIMPEMGEMPTDESGNMIMPEMGEMSTDESGNIIMPEMGEMPTDESGNLIEMPEDMKPRIDDNKDIPQDRENKEKKVN